MKKFLSVLLAVMLIGTLFVGCGGGDATTPPPASEAESTPADDTPAVSGGFKVSSHNAVVEGNAYRTVYEDQMTEAANAAKADGTVSQYQSFIANGDPALESQYLEQAINEGMDIIIVNPIAATGLDSVIDKAMAANITYINADCEYQSDKILNVVVNQREWARIQADFVVKTLGSGKKVIQFNGIDGNSASEMRNEVWKEVLTAGGLEIVKTVAHNWNDADSKQLMAEIISSGLEFDGIINQEAANGIMNAIEDAKIAMPGCITSSEEIAWIRRIAKINETEKVLPFIVVENPPGIGATALAVAINQRQGNTLKADVITKTADGNSVIYYAPQWIMTYDNMADKLQETANLPDSTSVSSYLTVAQAKEMYFQ